MKAILFSGLFVFSIHSPLEASQLKSSKAQNYNVQFQRCLEIVDADVSKELETQKDEKLQDTSRLIQYLLKDLKSNPEPLTKAQAEYLDSVLVNNLLIECSIQF
jgi:hypothetical protein